MSEISKWNSWIINMIKKWSEHYEFESWKERSSLIIHKTCEGLKSQSSQTQRNFKMQKVYIHNCTLFVLVQALPALKSLSNIAFFPTKYLRK